MIVISLRESETMLEVRTFHMPWLEAFMTWIDANCEVFSDYDITWYLGIHLIGIIEVANC